MTDEDPWRATIQMLRRDYPFARHTNAGRMFSTERRMKAERELGLPVARRSGFAISVASSRDTSELEKVVWDGFHKANCHDLAKSYPEMWAMLSSSAPAPSPGPDGAAIRVWPGRRPKVVS